MSAQMRSVSLYCVLVFFAALHAYVTVYINSSVVKQGGSDLVFTLTFVAGALLCLFGLFVAPRILAHIGNHWFLALVSTFEATALITLSTAPTGLLLFVSMALLLSMTPLIGYSLDIFFEQAVSMEHTTGSARGLFLTSANAALVVSPFIAGLIASVSLSGVYVFSCMIFGLFLFGAIPITASFKDPVYKMVTVRMFFSACFSEGRAVILVQLLLRIFYGFASIYMPLLLLYRGFSWPEIGIILSIALLPFILFELPLGRATDHFVGERDLLIIGFSILAIATAFLAYDLPHSVPLYAGVFFLTRIGASIVEVASEANFFRSVNSKDSSVIMLFRMAHPAGALIAITIGSLGLTIVPLPLLFVLAAVISFLGLIPSSHIARAMQTAGATVTAPSLQDPH